MDRRLAAMRVGMLTKEWPPDVYGGAGVHIEHLVHQLRHLIDVDVECFGAPKPGATSFPVPENLLGSNPAIETLGVDLAMAAGAPTWDIAHSHTWYANLAGHVTGLLQGIPHVLTAHSLEPLRPWKAEQLGGGYRISSWVESTSYVHADAVIAVSEGMRADILNCYPDVLPERVHVVHNGIDPDVYKPQPSEQVLAEYGIGSRPYVLFVGRITRQKGLVHLLRAAQEFDPGITLVMCASSPDTPEIEVETAEAVAALRKARGADSVVWIEEQVPREKIISLFTHALAFICPSIYEPLGIVNLEAMACETAVVASAVGGIPEVVADGITGVLVEYTADQPEVFEARLAVAVNSLAQNPERARALGIAGRERAIEYFSWSSIARQTIAVYEHAIETYRCHTP